MSGTATAEVDLAHSTHGARWHRAGGAGGPAGDHSHGAPLRSPNPDTASQNGYNVAAAGAVGVPQRRTFLNPTTEGDKRELYAQGRPQAKDAAGSGANWYLGTKSDRQVILQPDVESRLFFEGTVTATDMSRATDKREKDRLGIFGTGNSYAGSYGRVTSESLGRDLNPLGRGSGQAFVAGALNLGRISPRLAVSVAAAGSGNSINNCCGKLLTTALPQLASFTADQVLANEETPTTEKRPWYPCGEKCCIDCCIPSRAKPGTVAGDFKNFEVWHCKSFSHRYREPHPEIDPDNRYVEFTCAWMCCYIWQKYEIQVESFNKKNCKGMTLTAARDRCAKIGGHLDGTKPPLHFVKQVHLLCWLLHDESDDPNGLCSTKSDPSHIGELHQQFDEFTNNARKVWTEYINSCGRTNNSNGEGVKEDIDHVM